jgi:4-hydroxy-2-oxoglutarate aldolase
MAKIKEFTLKNKHEFYVIAGSAGFLLDALKAGASGGICALANVLGGDLVELYKLFKENDLTAAAELQKRLLEPNKAVTRLYGVPGLKASLDANGYYGGPCRMPLLPLKPSQHEDLRAIFGGSGYAWS